MEQNASGPPSILEVGSPISKPSFIHDLPTLHDPFIIGDVHGCYDELVSLLRVAGFESHVTDFERNGRITSVPQSLPTILFVGDLVDRGDRVFDTLEFVWNLVRSGIAQFVLGNHDFRFLKWLRGEDVQQTHGLAATIEEIERKSREERLIWVPRLVDLFSSAPWALRFDEGKGIVAHAAWRPGLKIEEDERRYRYLLYGPTTGERTPEGFPVRIDWAKSFKGPEVVVFGHQVYYEPYVHPFAIGIDTGCVFGGHLTGLRWRNRELLQVKSTYARAAYNRPDISFD